MRNSARAVQDEQFESEVTYYQEKKQILQIQALPLEICKI